MEFLEKVHSSVIDYQAIYWKNKSRKLKWKKDQGLSSVNTGQH